VHVQGLPAEEMPPASALSTWGSSFRIEGFWCSMSQPSRLRLERYAFRKASSFSPLALDGEIGRYIQDNGGADVNLQTTTVSLSRKCTREGRAGGGRKREVHRCCACACRSLSMFHVHAPRRTR